MCFGSIRNNTALKLTVLYVQCECGFGTIRNNTALKRSNLVLKSWKSFGTIRNNTALKQEVEIHSNEQGFWNHSKQHSSKTATAIPDTRPLVLEPFETTQL